MPLSKMIQDYLNPMSIILLGVIQLDIEVQESHLGEIADSMTEWEGSIADKLKLKARDVANIKTEYPKKLNLQT